MGRAKAGGRLFYLIFGALTVLAALPFLRSRLLPMQDYPHFLVFARAFSDCRDEASPFFGTYTVGFPLSPLLLPLVAVRTLARLSSLETAGRALWIAYAVGLPAASLWLLRVLRRDAWAVVLVFPLVISFWVIGGFFAFATSMPLLIVGLGAAVRWLESPSWKSGALLAAVVASLHLWHALAFAQLLLDFGVLWLLYRFESPGARLRALLPTLPGLGLFVAWLLATVRGRPPGGKPATWPAFFDNAGHFFDTIGPIVPEAIGATAILALLVLIASFAGHASPPSRSSGAFRVANPFAILALVAVACFLVMPSTCFGVEGIGNRQPYLAALFLVFGWTPPARGAVRSVALGLLAGASALVLLHLGRRFSQFDDETVGASRLIDRLAPGDSLLAPLSPAGTRAFPGKPLVALDQYGSIRKGSLPNSSFAGYEINFIRYVGGKNPMPGILGAAWLDHPGLQRFDYVLLRGAGNLAATRPKQLRQVARDGDWVLYGVCGSRAIGACR